MSWLQNLVQSYKRKIFLVFNTPSAILLISPYLSTFDICIDVVQPSHKQIKFLSKTNSNNFDSTSRVSTLLYLNLWNIKYLRFIIISFRSKIPHITCDMLRASLLPFNPKYQRLFLRSIYDLVWKSPLNPKNTFTSGAIRVQSYGNARHAPRICWNSWIARIQRIEWTQ